jgi:type II secretory pathway pseudopilin PulG
MATSSVPRARRRFRFGHLILILVILAGLIGAALPWIRKQQQASLQTRALDNLRQLGTALFEFDSEYGTFPDNNTAEDVKENTGTALDFTGPYSNDYFRQLIAEDPAPEQAFWCKTSFSPKRPDNITEPPARALEAGEVGFSYVMATKTEGQSSSGDPGRAVVVAPSYEARADWTFDPKPFRGKALVLKLDNSASALPIGPDFTVPLGSLFKHYIHTTGDGAPWGQDLTPRLLAPLPSATPNSYNP